jgi:colanic acid biosynthesis glycosyl transferase WcaI
MDVLILSQYFAPEIGAPQTRLRAIVDELASRGIRVRVVTAMPNYPEGEIRAEYRRRLLLTEQARGVTIHRVWMYPAKGAGFGRLAGYLSFAAMSVIGLVRAGRRPSIVFVESPPLTTALPGLVYAKLCRAKAVLNVADLWPDAAVEVGALATDGRAAKVAYRLEAWAYRRADFINFVTDGVYSALCGKGVPDRKLIALPNGVDARLFPTSPLPTDSPRRFLYAGTIGLNHGADILVLAVARCRDQDVIVNLEFLGGGSDRLRLEAIARELALDTVTFRDPVSLERLPEEIAHSHVGVVSAKDMPTTRGGRPSKLFPFLSCGRPILFSGAGEGAQIVSDAEAGIVVANEVEATADAFCRLSSMSAPVLQEFGDRSAALATNYSWTATIELWLESLVARTARSNARSSASGRNL